MALGGSLPQINLGVQGAHPKCPMDKPALLAVVSELCLVQEKKAGRKISEQVSEQNSGHCQAFRDGVLMSSSPRAPEDPLCRGIDTR
ncbi:hypothetical protein TNCV_2671131 [Trichonephila clavipes]|nr:hypothetical protein TNCV_2671131 [Trichonephila clavipes]